MFRSFLLILSTFLVFGTATPGFASKRVALVIGNSAYQNAPELINPKNDAQDMVGRLKSFDFSVVEGIDLDLKGVRGKIREFVGQLGTADIALFYYAGHGLQVNGKNYLVPVDAALQSHLDLDFEAVPMNLILGAMEENVDTSILFLDACRNNPLSRTLARSMGKRSTSIGRGLARIGASKGTLISFATQPGNVALDGSGRNSPFTAALLKHLGTPGDSITDGMIKVRNEVIKITKGKQVPWEHSSLTGRVVLTEKVKKVGVGKKTNESVPNEVIQNSTARSNITVELAYWDSIKNADASIYYNIYLKRYPEGIFAEIAKLRISEIEKRIAKLEIAASQKAKLEREKLEKAELKKVEKLALLEQPKVKKTIAPTVDRSLEITDRGTIRELQKKLFDLNYEPGSADGVMGTKTRLAINEFQESINHQKSGRASQNLMKILRNTPIPNNWGGLGFLVSKKRVFEKSKQPNRRAARAAVSKACLGCANILIFSGDECGALAMSARGWGWAVRTNRGDTETAAINACSQFGGKCELQSLVCANGS